MKRFKDFLLEGNLQVDRVDDTKKFFNTVIEIYQNTIDVLSKYDITAILCGGSYLGFLRQGSLLEWDSDIDFYCVKKEMEVNEKKIAKDLEKNGFYMNKTWDWFYQIFKLEDIEIENKEKIKNLQHLPHNDIFLLNENKDFYIYKSQHLKTHYYKFPKKLFDRKNCKYYDFYDRKILLPKDSNDLVELAKIQYGDNWLIPNLNDEKMKKYKINTTKEKMVENYIKYMKKNFNINLINEYEKANK